jgi:hypothetical protein
LLELLATEQLLFARGALYVDFKPQHLVVEKRGGIRLLDAGGVCRLGLDSGAPVPITPRYAGVLPPGKDGQQRAEIVARRSLARTLYELWTGRSAPLKGPLSFSESTARAPAWLCSVVTQLEASAPTPWTELVAVVDQGNAAGMP